MKITRSLAITAALLPASASAQMKRLRSQDIFKSDAPSRHHIIILNDENTNNEQQHRELQSGSSMAYIDSSGSSSMSIIMSMEIETEPPSITPPATEPPVAPVTTPSPTTSPPITGSPITAPPTSAPSIHVPAVASPAPTYNPTIHTTTAKPTMGLSDGDGSMSMSMIMSMPNEEISSGITAPPDDGNAMATATPTSTPTTKSPTLKPTSWRDRLTPDATPPVADGAKSPQSSAVSIIGGESFIVGLIATVIAGVQLF